MNIFEDPIFVIMNNDGNIIRVQVNKTYTFKKLQTRIQNDCGIPLKLQCFICEDERNYADMDKEEGEEAADDNILQTEDATNIVTTSKSNDVTDINSSVDIQMNDSDRHDMINVKERTSCTFFITYITLKGIDGKASAIFVKENETIEAVMYRIQERSGLSLDHQEFTCFDKRTLEEKFWEEEYKRFNSTSSPKAISSLIPKIIECNLETLYIYKQYLSLSEYNFLIASGTIVCLTLYSCTIEDDDGNAVTVDKLFDTLRLIHTFDMHCSNKSSWFDLDTVKKMVRIISRFRKLQCLGFHGLPETFDISSFTDFVLKNSSVDIRLAFSVQLSAAYKKWIVNFMDEILQKQPKKVPRLQFPSYAEDSKFAEYDKLYRCQK
uniref:Ubiquitin-like domain-containing protein n=1 Tax=Panagrolaimus sp. PS1159 TaxID=55785 RepID=A0AC35FUI9_9BILA